MRTTVPSLDLYLHDRRVGTIEPVPRDRTRVALHIDREYRPDILLTESFATIPGRRPPADEVSNFLGGYVPEGNHRERVAAKRRIDKDDLFALLNEFGGSIAGAVTLRRPDEARNCRPTYEGLGDRAASFMSTVVVGVLVVCSGADDTIRHGAVVADRNLRSRCVRLPA
jgi:serine/threonine-protein kinase HipA